MAITQYTEINPAYILVVAQKVQELKVEFKNRRDVMRLQKNKNNL